MNNPKQVIIMRKDLNMRKGKMCAQASHASMAALLAHGYVTYGPDGLGGTHTTDFVLPLDRSELHDWITGSFTKICVGVDSEQELVDIITKAKDKGLITSLITDSGLTEFGGVPTITCGVIGPAYADDINGITGHLKLL